MSLYSFVIPLGITTLILFIIAALLGLRSNILKTKIRLRIHKITALVAIGLALFHAGIVIYYNFF